MKHQTSTPHVLLLIIIWLTLLLAVTSGLDTAVSASSYTQSEIPEENELWETPINLSNSGAASDPRVVVDANGIAHIIWREDVVNGYFYTNNEGGQWLEPMPLEFPFATRQYATDLNSEDPTPLYNPRLIADANDLIHAFWIVDENILYHSAVLSSEIEIYDSWSRRQELAESVLDFSVAVDSVNGLHLGYVHVPHTPTGIYYRQLVAGENEWSEPELVFQSAYFRSLAADEANVQIAPITLPEDESGVITETVTISTTNGFVEVENPVEVYPARALLAWENPLVEQVFSVRTPGENNPWDKPQIIDEREPEDNIESVGPSLVNMITVGDREVHLIWIAGNEVSCHQYHQWSADGGDSWETAVAISEEEQACPTAHQLIVDNEGILFLLTKFDEESYLQAWNGSEWSVPESQPLLTSFSDPVTHRLVDFGCEQTAVTNDNNLLVVGCREDRVNDIWLLQRPLDTLEEWFPPVEVPVWSPPAAIYSNESSPLSPVLLTDNTNLLHAFWIETTESTIEKVPAKLYYAQWDGMSWSRFVPLLALPSQKADHLSAVIDVEGLILVMWRDPQTNTFSYSQVNVNNVLLPADWSTPQELPTPHTLFGNHWLYVDKNNRINVIYAVPLNENRGIYLMQTQDGGKTWSDPVSVVDGAAAGWEMVDQPQIVQSTNGQAHALWTRFDLRPDPVATALYTAHSKDGGQSWSTPESIVEGQIIWSRIADVGQQGVVTTWQQADPDQVQIWSRQSLDDGISWDIAVPVLRPTTDSTAMMLTGSGSNKLYLVQTTADAVGNLTLQESFWHEDGWQAIEEHDLDIKLADASLFGLTGELTFDDQLMLLYSTDSIPQKDEPMESSMLFTRRSFDGSAVEQAPQIVELPTSEPLPTALPTALPTITPTVTPVAKPSPTPASLIIDSDTNMPGSETAVDVPQAPSSPPRFLIGLFPLVLVAGILVVLSLRSIRWRWR